MTPAVTGLSPPSAANRMSSMSRTKYSSPTARTNGSANGSSISPLPEATALATAPNVAVTPTPVAGSQLSPAARAIVG